MPFIHESIWRENSIWIFAQLLAEATPAMFNRAARIAKADDCVWRIAYRSAQHALKNSNPGRSDDAKSRRDDRRRTKIRFERVQGHFHRQTELLTNGIGDMQPNWLKWSAG